MDAFEFKLETKLVFGAGAIGQLGEIASGLGFRRTLLVSDAGVVAAGHAARAIEILRESRVEASLFSEFASNPTASMVERGRQFAAGLDIDSIIGLGGGSSLDMAKGINFVLTNGGAMRDYRGFGRAARPLLPMIGVPTTAGTGSEAQSCALISDDETHEKMACGDRGAAFRVALLDPELSLTQPRAVTASAGFDAIAHAVETFVTKRRNPLSDMLSREAWRLLDANYERVLSAPEDMEARGAMLLGSFIAGAAIENSMLGATHACANPLTARFAAEHGVAIALMLPHVVRWNSLAADAWYGELLAIAGIGAPEGNASDVLARRLEALRSAAGLPASLAEFGVSESDLEMLAADAALQWTGQHNPREFSSAGALEIYRRAIPQQCTQAF